MIGAAIVGFLAGVIGRVIMPGDPFHGMSGPKSWGVSVLIGLAGAALGYLIFTVGLGIGDTDVFDFGGIIGAIIGVVIVLAIAGAVMKNRAARRRTQGPHLPDRALLTPASRSSTSCPTRGQNPFRPPSSLLVGTGVKRPRGPIVQSRRQPHTQ